MARGKRWTREELLITLNLYHKLRFGQFHARQPSIIDLSAKLGRPPGSLAMKLSNLASLDPALQLRGIRRLAGASNFVRLVWQEFHKNPDEAIPASEEALRKLFDASEETALDIDPQDFINSDLTISSFAYPPETAHANNDHLK